MWVNVLKELLKTWRLDYKFSQYQALARLKELLVSPRALGDMPNRPLGCLISRILPNGAIQLGDKGGLWVMR